MTRIAAARLPDTPSPERPQVGIGHNRPSPDEMARIDFKEAIDRHAGLRQRIEDLAGSAGRASATDDDSAARCAELIRQMGAVERVVEDERKSVKEPFLLAGRAIDDEARTVLGSLVPAKAEVRRITENYMREKQRIEDEKRRVAEEAARREAERERALAAEQGRAPEPVAPPPKAVEPTRVRSDFGAVASARKVKVAVIVDWKKAFNKVKDVPAVQEAVQKAVNALVRANPNAVIPGVEVRDDVGLSVR